MYYNNTILACNITFHRESWLSFRKNNLLKKCKHLAFNIRIMEKLAFLQKNQALKNISIRTNHIRNTLEFSNT